MEGKIIYEGETNDGEKFVIRYPKNDDAPGMLHYINTISKEQTLILFQGEQLTLAYEEKYLKELLEKISEKKALQLQIWIDNRLVGSSSLEMRDRAEKHVGYFGISLAAEYRGIGLGTKLTELMLKEAKETIPQLQIIVLSAFATNSTALHMYKKFGFKEFGRLPEGLVRHDQYIDHIEMYKKIR